MDASEKRKKIISYIINGRNEITKKEAVDLLKHTYYCNADKHVGSILSRMVKSGLLIRVSNGVFKIGKMNKGQKEIKNQLNLFG